MRRIEKLTAGQESLLPAVRDEWLRHGLSTAPADKQAAEAGIRAAYQAAGLQPPLFIIWLASPWAGVIAQAVAPEIILELFDSQVDSQVASQVRSQVASQVYSQVYSQVASQVASQVDSQVDSQVARRLQNWWNHVMYGQHWAGYYSYYDAMERLGVTGIEAIRGQQAAARAAGWWWPCALFAVVTDRPEELHRDIQGRLHSPDGPAIRYRDGWGFHAWHGTRMPAGLCQGDLTIERILREPNSEVRRCAVEMTGWDRLEAQLGTPVASCADPGNPGRTLALYDVPDGLYEAPVRLVLMTNGSLDRSGAERRYGETVPAEISDPLSAQAWAYGVPRATYAALSRRT